MHKHALPWNLNINLHNDNSKSLPFTFTHLGTTLEIISVSTSKLYIFSRKMVILNPQRDGNKEYMHSWRNLI